MASESNGTWDVFLSFRGEDTRNNFTSHLHYALDQKGIRTFIDDELRSGEQISDALLKVIEESKISIIVFSENYASSSWCLNELLKILECKKEKNQMVIPVFYKVKPSDVRHQKNSFEKALAKLDKYFSGDLKMQSWRNALNAAANLSGHPLEINGNESKVIKDIVQVVSRIVNPTHLDLGPYPVGIESRVRNISLRLCIAENDTRMVGIVGGGGIGKTTLAKEIYNSNANQFEGSCFLANVREISKQKNGLIKLQKIMLSDILGDTSLKVHSTDRGISVIKDRFSHKKVLLVLDDVDDKLSQLDKLARSCDWFGLGSRIIITTRDKSLLTSHGVGVGLTYEVKGLNDHEALELFSCHAFERKKPIDDYVKLTEEVISYCGGLPLALRVLGSALYHKSKHHWKSALDKYKKNPHKSIQEVLEISYDELDDSQKSIFLDVACFFKGESVDYVTKILVDDHDISVLVDKCLITIEDEKLGMHDLVQDMGREIVRKESPTKPGKRSRLWFHKDVVPVLEDNLGTKKVEGILVDFPEHEQDTIHLHLEAFRKMVRLRIFINRNAKFSGQVNYLSNELRLLDWPEYPSKSLPFEFRPRKLVVLIMRNGLIKKLEGLKNFSNMRIMKFFNCEFLTKIPDLSGMPNLEELTIYDCTNLIEVDNSVGSLNKLSRLQISGCFKVRSFPRSLKSRSLKTLDIGEDCPMLENFPDIEVNMECMDLLSLRGSHIIEVTSSFENLVSCKELSLRGRKNLEGHRLQNPSENWAFYNFEANYLSFRNCILSESDFFFTLNDDDDSFIWLDLSGNNFVSLPACINCLVDLLSLDLSRNNFVSLPACINCFVDLWSLKLTDCEQLQEILQLPPNLKKLYVDGCISLERCKLPVGLEWIDLSECHKLIGNIGNDMKNLLLDVVKVCMHVCHGGDSEFGIKYPKNDIPFGVMYPGNKIPYWFSHCQEASSPICVNSKYRCHIDFKEPSDLDREIIGTVLCVVFKINDGEAPTKGFSANVNICHNYRYSYKYTYNFHLFGSDHVWLLYIPGPTNILVRPQCILPTRQPKKGYSRVEFDCSHARGSVLSLGVHFERKYDEKAKERVNEYTNPPQDEDVKFSFDVFGKETSSDDDIGNSDEDIGNSTVTKRLRDDYCDYDDDKMESMP